MKLVSYTTNLFKNMLFRIFLAINLQKFKNCEITEQMISKEMYINNNFWFS